MGWFSYVWITVLQNYFDVVYNKNRKTTARGLPIHSVRKSASVNGKLQRRFFYVWITVLQTLE